MTRRKNISWSEEEDATLAELCKISGISIDDITRVLRIRSRNAIVKRMYTKNLRLASGSRIDVNALKKLKEVFEG